MEKAPLTEQIEKWTGDFGQEYTRRNALSDEEMDKAWEQNFGIRKTAIFREFMAPEIIPQGKVLEVGCNIGIQLRLLRSVNPGLDMWEIEPQQYARQRCRELSPEFNILPGTTFDLPFRDGFFDVVMTNGVLIHIKPDDVPSALREIRRCTSRSIFLCEYFAERPTEVTYRGEQGLLWKMDYKQAYLDSCPGLRCVRERFIHHVRDGVPLVDQVALIESDE